MGWNTSNGQWRGYCWYDLVSNNQKWSPKEYLQRTDAVLKKDNVFRTFITLLREVKEKYDPAFVNGLKKKLWILMAKALEAKKDRSGIEERFDAGVTYLEANVWAKID
ncbi:MAG: hypothetical protein IJS52_03230 [Bacilli bacterium]|nr:hypothetical protein [Bacilli bacterium]